MRLVTQQRDGVPSERTYLLLKFEGDASDWSLLDTFHQVRGVTGNLVSKSLCLDDGHIIDDSLIYMEVVGQPKQKRVRFQLQPGTCPR